MSAAHHGIYLDILVVLEEKMTDDRAETPTLTESLSSCMTPNNSWFGGSAFSFLYVFKEN